ncbi:MAG TPA: sigma-70 family RNA polymerase sigma factor [Acidimicrobiales bacterium]
MSRTRRDAGFAEAYPDLAVVAYRVGYRIVGRRAEAEDVAQEALARAYARWPRVQGHAEAWVGRVAANLALDVHRRLERDRRHGRMAAPGIERPAAAALVLDRMELVALLRSLPRRQREVLTLRYLADLPERETAEALGCSVGAVKQHGHRALATLRQAVANPTGTPPATDPAEPLCEPGGL